LWRSIIHRFATHGNPTRKKQGITPHGVMSCFFADLLAMQGTERAQNYVDVP
jgi:hypothetical protein